MQYGTADNSDVVISLGPDNDVYTTAQQISWSYSAVPTTGALLVEKVDSEDTATTIFQLDIRDSGPGIWRPSSRLQVPKTFKLKITLKAGGAGGNIGRLIVEDV